MKEGPATAGEARAAFNDLCLLRASCYRLFAGCQEPIVNKVQGALHWEKRGSDFALESPFWLPCGRGKTTTGI